MALKYIRQTAFVLIFSGIVSCANAQPTTNDTLKQQAAFGIAKDMMDRGELEQAEILFRKLVQMYPNNGLAYYYLGQLLERSPGKSNDAIAAYEQANRLGPEEEYGLKAYVAAELLRKRAAQKAADDERRVEAERQRQEAARQQAEAETVSRDDNIRRTILKSLAQKYVIVWRDNGQAINPNETYCIWLNAFPSAVSLSGQDSGTWTLRARIANRSDIADFNWPATATWQDNPIRLEIRRSNQGPTFGLNLLLIGNTYHVQAADFPYPVRFAERDRSQSCTLN